jgi:deoxyribodipyrimidine photolyase-related protein
MKRRVQASAVANCSLLRRTGAVSTLDPADRPDLIEISSQDSKDKELLSRKRCRASSIPSDIDVTARSSNSLNPSLSSLRESEITSALSPVKTVRLILGDQLNMLHSWFKIVDPCVLYVMMEVRSETDNVVHHAQKLIAIFAAMRRMAQQLRDRGHRVFYYRIGSPGNSATFAENLSQVLATVKASCFEYQEPDDWRVDTELRSFCDRLSPQITCSCVSSEHFLDRRDGVSQHFTGKKRWLMESYYRQMRGRLGLLVRKDGTPEGGQWNFDHENRKRWTGAPAAPRSWDLQHDHTAIWAEITAAGVKTMGKPAAATFPWPVDRSEALSQLSAFIECGLPLFGQFEDAMHTESDRLFHSRLSFAMNVKLLSPAEVVGAAVAAHQSSPKKVPIAATEGFVRQIIGWREYIRGVYWAKMPDYARLNTLNHTVPLPSWFWSGKKVRMNCMNFAVGQSLDTAYAHHIQRLMVIGSFCLTAGIDPSDVEKWYLGVYVDAFQWVELPNVIGMSQYADGGFLGTKPYCCGANYISKMSNYCEKCYYNANERTGEKACPMNALYWNFWLRHSEELKSNPRIGMAVHHARKMSDVEKTAVRKRAAQIIADIEDL